MTSCFISVSSTRVKKFLEIEYFLRTVLLKRTFVCLGVYVLYNFGPPWTILTKISMLNVSCGWQKCGKNSISRKKISIFFLWIQRYCRFGGFWKSDILTKYREKGWVRSERPLKASHRLPKSTVMRVVLKKSLLSLSEKFDKIRWRDSLVSS